MVQYRDIFLKQQKRQDLKQDKREPLRIVITDAQGNQTGSGSIWANEDERRVWYMVEGAIQPGQALCRRISDPSIGLGARLGYANHGSNTKEVLEDDLFIAQTGDASGWSSTSPRDLEPGGIKNLWIYSKVITPLATYPAASGLFANVIAGDYPYIGTRKTFLGQINIALTQNPNVGEHYYAGLYLDSANTLQVVYGASVVVASTPTEPTWPAGAFRLSVVRVNDTQTSISFANDIVDRRMAWSDEQGGTPAASQAEVDLGTEAAKYVSPLTFQTGLSTRLGNVLRPGPIVNGAFQFWQRGTSFVAPASLDYTADRFKYGKSGLMVHTVSQSSDVPTVAQAGIIAPFSYLVDCTTIDATIGAGDLCIITQNIEGNFALPILQRDFIVSFWVKATKTGIYCMAFQNSGADRSYVVEYTISVTDTWEYKTIPVTASPTAGTWLYTTGIGLRVHWILACGSTYHTTAGAWQTGDFLATSNQVNACDSTSNDFRLALIKVEPGTFATPFVLPDYQQEFARCSRYFQKSYALATAPATVTTSNRESYQTRTALAASTAGSLLIERLNFLSRMRVAPTVTLYSDATGTSGAVRNNNAGADRTGATAQAIGETGFGNVNADNTSATVIALDNTISFHYTAAAEL